MVQVNPELHKRMQRQARIFDTPVHHELVRGAREALLWHMSWNEYCALPDPVYYAYIDAWNELQAEEKEASKSK